MDDKEDQDIYSDLPGKLRPWLKAYLNSDDPTTYLNKTESAARAGYNGTRQTLSEIGCQNSRKLKSRIDKWLEEEGLSDHALKSKLVKGMEVEMTQFFTVRGVVSEADLPPGVRVIATGMQAKSTQPKKGEPALESVTIVGINVAAIEVRRKFLEMAMKTKGMFNNDTSAKPVININLDSRIKKGESEE